MQELVQLRGRFFEVNFCVECKAICLRELVFQLLTTHGTHLNAQATESETDDITAEEASKEALETAKETKAKHVCYYP